MRDFQKRDYLSQEYLIYYQIIIFWTVVAIRPLTSNV